MHDGQLVVTFAALHQAGDDIRNAVSGMQSTLADLEQAAQPLVSTWEGGAQQAYQQRQQQWRSAAEDLTTMLNEIQRAVMDSAQDYAATEKANTALFQ